VLRSFIGCGDQPNQTTIMKNYIYTVSALAIASSMAFAQEKPKGPAGPGGPGKGERPPPEAIFKKLDTNGDGAISLEEFKASPRGKMDPTKAEEIFKKIDTNGDGSLSLEEFKAHKPPHHGQGHGKAEGKGGEAPPAAPPTAPPAE